MDLKEPPRTPRLEQLCGTCFPQVGDHNTMCETCFNRMNVLDFATQANHGDAVSFESTETIETIAAKSIPARYQQADDKLALPALRGVDVRTQSVLLSGPGGRGKTYQAALLMRLAVRRSGEYEIPQPYRFQWHSEVALIERLRSLQKVDGAASDLIRKLITADVFVLDDYGAEKATEWVRARLYHVLNARYESGRAIVVTTNLTLGEMEKRSTRFAGRVAEMAGDYFLEYSEADPNYRIPRSATGMVA